MKVIIVAKTRRGSSACIGGISSSGRSVRLIAADAADNERAGMEYEVGDVWEIEAEPVPQPRPPHTEDVLVTSQRRLRTSVDPTPTITKHMPPKEGGTAVLFDGLLQTTSSGALFVAERSGVPDFSTLFWRPDRPLQRVSDGKRLRYRYPSQGLLPADRACTLAFVGFQEPVAEIPAGALVRVSLAHWWRPEGEPEEEPRCYVQLSGWFLPVPVDPADDTAEDPVINGTGSAQPADPGQAARRAGGAAVAPRDVPSMDDAKQRLKSVFGYDGFRPLQAEIIANVLAGRDTLAVMPTGSGKSLCYQLPALLMGGLTVVVSPLISLMQDQVAQLRAAGVQAAFLNSTLDLWTYRETTRQARAGAIRLLYTSPETLLRPETQVLMDECRISCLAIDEAHCISAWGHDFRPEYRQLLAVRQRYPRAVCIALTATATPRVQEDIRESLGCRDGDSFVAGFDRPNLYLAAQPRAGGLAQTTAFLSAHRDQSGIIYCATQRGVDTLTAQLAAEGWPVLPYHAGQDGATRLANQESFSRDRTPIMVATIAFGMGIDKSNVRFVLHQNLPESIEQYYQEIGRAGRDDMRADCLLLFSRSDLQTINWFIENGAESERAGRRARLQAMWRYAEARSCRRSLLLDYFGDSPAASWCGFCDNCSDARPPVDQIDASEAARLFLNCVRLTGQIFGMAHIIDVLRGSRSQKVVGHGHDRLPCHSQGRGTDVRRWRYLAGQFIARGLLAQDMQHGSLSLTDRGRAVSGGTQVLVDAEQSQPAPGAFGAGPETGYDAILFEQLRALRREIAGEEDVPSYVVFPDRSLAEMATWYPASLESLRAVHGVGERKLERYGYRFLEVIRSYCAANALSERPRPAAVLGGTRRTSAAGARSEEVGELFAAGRTMPELQELYNVQQSTIVTHLLRCTGSGRRFDPGQVIAASRLDSAGQASVLEAMAALGHERLSPIYDALDGLIPYNELHLMRLYYLCRTGAGDGQHG